MATELDPLSRHELLADLLNLVFRDLTDDDLSLLFSRCYNRIDELEKAGAEVIRAANRDPEAGPTGYAMALSTLARLTVLDGD